MQGRELREGCLIASVGGGLCQLSNALYEAALDAGFDIVERHAHSRVVQGSRAAAERDATVFWNYVDLRFRSSKPFRVEAALRHGALEVVLRGGKAPVLAKDSDLRAEEGLAANDCTSCAETACHHHDPEQPLLSTDEEPTAWLVDACWPEFSILFAATAREEDALFVPQRLRQSPRHAWPQHVVAEEKCATLVALRRALSLRHAPKQGRALQDFWGRAKARPLEGPDWPEELAAVVLPALVEHEPRALLKALAHGLPVIATQDCGLGAMDGVTTVPAYDASALRNVMSHAISLRFA